MPYGFLGVAFSLYLNYLNFSNFAVGVVITLTVLSSALYTFVVSFVADRIGRRKTLVFFALTDFIAGTLLFTTSSWWAPVLAGIVGNMTVGAGEVGPFLSLEQAMVPRTCEPVRRTRAFSVYNLAGYGASAFGALLAEVPSAPSLDQLRPFFLLYLASGLTGALLYSRLSGGIEADDPRAKRPPLSAKSRPIVVRLSALFAIDAFGGGFIGGNLLSLYFHERFGLELSSLGLIFFATQVVTALSFLLAEPLARRIGLLRTMVFSHVPSNVFLVAVAFAPTPLSAVGLLLCRQSLSQMDVPTRQSYVMAIVDETDRMPAAGLTSTTRTVSSSLSPSLAGYGMGIWLGVPLVAAGTLKLAYDTLIYYSFRRVKPPEEMAKKRG